MRAQVQFRRASGTEARSQSACELPLSQPAPEAAASTWTLWGRGTASGFNNRPKDDFSMDGDVFTGSLGLDSRL